MKYSELKDEKSLKVIEINNFEDIKKNNLQNNYEIIVYVYDYSMDLKKKLLEFNPFINVITYIYPIPQLDPHYLIAFINLLVEDKKGFHLNTYHYE